MTAMARFESLRVTTPGATLAVRHYPGTGEPIVLLHGGPGMGDYFGALPELLSPPYRVVSYDQRGCGASSCDGSFDVHDQVATSTPSGNISARTGFISSGTHGAGCSAQLYANGHPQHVGSVVLCCSMANTGRKVAMVESKGIAERVIGRPKHSPVAWLAAGLLMQFPGRLGDLGFGYIMKQLLPNYVVRRDAAPRDFEVNRASKRAWRGTNTSVKALDDDYLAQLSVNAPILIVQGEHDVIRETNPLL